MQNSQFMVEKSRNSTVNDSYQNTMEKAYKTQEYSNTQESKLNSFQSNSILYILEGKNESLNRKSNTLAEKFIKDENMEVSPTKKSRDIDINRTRPN